MNAAVFIPVRLCSARKAMKKIQGKPCIQHLVERVKRAKGIDLIVLCTTNNKTDDDLVEMAKQLEIGYFRGSETDILERYNQAARKFSVGNIVNVDGDDIFCEPSFIDITAETLRSTDADCIMWDGAPLGASPIGIRGSALEKICSLKDTSNTETGWTKFFTETGMFCVKHLQPRDPELRDASIRLTLDYEEDLKLFKEIYNNLKEPFSLKDIVRLLHANPELQKLNENLKDVYMQNFNSKAAKVKLKGSPEGKI
jgi:spore coat polysaccharide biosynthesis protein SpsF